MRRERLVSDNRSIVPANSNVIAATTTFRMQFEPYLPASCPPNDAITGPKTLFRLTISDAIKASDFLTTHEEGKFLSGDPCQRCSLSTLASEEAAKEHRRLIRFLNSRKIAKGTVPEGAGMIKHTPSQASYHHWSWWPARGVVRHEYFEMIDEAA